MPSLPPQLPVVAAPRRRRSKKETRTVHVSVFNYTPERDWADLHPDLISRVFHKLNLVELLAGGVARVCSSWRRAAREDPELWRRMRINLHRGLWFRYDLKFVLVAMVRDAALRFSKGQCKTFCSDLADDDILLVLARQAHYRNRLFLYRCPIVTKEGLAKGDYYGTCTFSDYHPYSPVCSYCRPWNYLEYDADESYEACCYYLGDGDDVDEADLEEHEKILDIKSMRRYLS
ncbi:hypothetical protein VPH35_114981 [Triticum aestivum]|uniref:uncharacterized protein isoform X1 n=1 Tax=Triticum aestivum TaxID=4565 RepID=UPI001D02F836|nr:uncharacterized protein LOC123140901 isoform X1 [Triticum aestivum]